MENTNQTIDKVVAEMPDGSMVRDFEYSQGQFEMTTTYNPIEAYDFSNDRRHDFGVFVENKGGRLQAIEITIDVKKVGMDFTCLHEKKYRVRDGLSRCKNCGRSFETEIQN